jgi:hypothetical protein
MPSPWRQARRRLRRHANLRDHSRQLQQWHHRGQHLSRLNGKGPADARAFAGIAYRVTADGDQFEAVYLRP